MRDSQLCSTGQGAAGARRTAPLTIGPWRLIRRLGESEWCEVYQAAPQSVAAGMTADYVVKLVRPAMVRNPQAVALLQNEAHVAGEISHPHVVCLLSAHVDRPPFYLVMPYLRGASLRGQLQQRHRLPVANSLWIVRQVAEGLHALHEKGWAHGDVKPENVRVAENGHTTLCDLGLACRLENGDTRRAMMTGTPAYMPPEAFSDREPRTASADSYSLGIMLFEMLTGRLPFPHEHADELMAAHRLLRAPDPRTIVPTLPAGVCHLVRQLLAKEPIRRPWGKELIDWLVNAEIDLFELRQAA